MQTDNNAKSTNAEQPAFPLKEPLSDDTLGLTKREYFAAMAMQGWLASWPSDSWLKEHEKLAECSVQIADALLRQLKK